MKNEPQGRLWALMIGSLGVVYGDIGTSPLYALRECFGPEHGVEATPAHVLGIVSLVFWTLTLIVSVKYLAFVMRANNRGEGGVLALLALLHQGGDVSRGKLMGRVLILGVFGAALLYGDGMITPAITVLSAVEGLKVATPLFKPYVLPISVAILVLLFSLQRHGTGRIGIIFGPVMVIWFLVLFVLGLRSAIQTPAIFTSLNPYHALHFLFENPRQSFVVLGAVFLAVTGVEALYADMGHFGAIPIRRTWFGVVFPGLILNYFGQGALILRDPAAVQNPFYLLAPSWAVYWLVGLAALAAVIASQALISGTYSLTMQGIQMGLLPRMKIRHTSQSAMGQIYVPTVNWALMVACVGLVLGFRSSSNLASAYGIAVSLTMLITTALFYAAARHLWKWPTPVAGSVAGVFFVIELAFVCANGLKVLNGGWFPLLIGLVFSVSMLTWSLGRKTLRDRLAGNYLPFDLFLQDLSANPPLRVPGIAVYLSGNPAGTPLALLHNLKHNKVLHEQVIILSILNRDVPHVASEDRLKVEQLRPDIFRLTGYYGFMEQPDIPELLNQLDPKLLPFEMMKATYFLSRETIIPGRKKGMAFWRKQVFAALSRNAQPVTAYFNLPANRVVELGMQVEL
jgi:KUP system potassium uptake protein